eukprot:6482195-Amphidinium_carterae.1
MRLWKLYGGSRGWQGKAALRDFLLHRTTFHRCWAKQRTGVRSMRKTLQYKSGKRNLGSAGMCILSTRRFTSAGILFAGEGGTTLCHLCIKVAPSCLHLEGLLDMVSAGSHCCIQLVLQSLAIATFGVAMQ